MSTDRIEKKILLRAPLERVWSAISDAEQFGKWFGVALDGPFVAGERLTGKIAPTTVDADVAKLQELGTVVVLRPTASAGRGPATSRRRAQRGGPLCLRIVG
jgi:hypothetical protein